MDLYDPDFHDAIAYDERLKKIAAAVGDCAARKLGQYAAREVGHLKDVHSTRL